MPEASKEVLSALVAVGEMGAISLDTSVIEKYGADLRNRVVLSLKQFNRTSVAVLFSDIVANEVKSHIAEKAGETITQVLKELRNHRKIWGHDESAEELGARAHLARSPTDFADQRWKSFADALEAEMLVAADLIRIDEVTARYFSNATPFSGTGKKKAEFPDAIALLSLEAWAKRRGTKVLIISADRDWQNFARQSLHMFCLPDIPEALDLFNREAHFVAERTMAFLDGQKTSDAWSQIESAVELFVEENSWEIEVDASPYDPESTMQGGALQYWEAKSTPLVIATYEDDIASSVNLECTISFEARFYWQIYANGEWHSMSHSTSETTEVTRILQFTITCSRDIEPEPEVNEVVVASKPFTVDFGYVDPGLDYEE